MVEYPFRYLHVLGKLLEGGTPLELAIFSDQYAQALHADFKALKESPEAADSFFGLSQIHKLSSNPVSEIGCWMKMLEVLLGCDAEKYEKIHKGTPYYFISIASYVSGDFERALFFMDAAVDEDRRIHGDLWRQAPSGLFFTLETEHEDQAGIDIVRQIRDILETEAAEIFADGCPYLSHEQLLQRLVFPAVEGQGEVRSAVTALFTFILELSSRLQDLELTPSHVGSREPLFLHLFKGALVFETLLRVSGPGLEITRERAGATLGQLLKDERIFSQIGYEKPPIGPGGDTLEDAIRTYRADCEAALPYQERAIRTTWAFRNRMGHSLVWMDPLDRNEYVGIYRLILGAIFTAIEGLF